MTQRGRLLWALVLCLSWGMATPQCFTWYRYDLLEQWIVPVSSRLCKANITAPLEQDRYMLSSQDGTMHIKSLGFDSDIDKNWISEKATPFSVSVYRKGLSDPHFLTLQVTEDKSLQGNYQHSVTGGIKGNSRSAYFISPQEISSSGGDLRLWMFLTFYISFGVLAALGIFAHVMNVGMAFALFLVVGFSCITAWVKFTSLTWFIVTLIIILVLAAVVGVLNFLWGKALGSIFCGLLLAAYFFFGGMPEHRYAFGFAAGLLALIAAVFTWKLERITAFQKLKFFWLLWVYWLVLFQFWSYIWHIYPTELYFRVFKGPLDYHVGASGSGISMYLPSLCSLLGAALCMFLCGMLAHRRSHLGSYGLDSNEKESLPLL